MHGARLILTSLAFIAGMAVAVPLATAALGTAAGLLLIFTIYWFGFCLPLGWAFQEEGAIRRSLSLAVGRARWVPWAVAVQLAGAALASALLAPCSLGVGVLVAAAIFALVNGFCEEVFWRGAFLAEAKGRVWFLALGVAIFGLWHAPLLLAQGVTYPGGAAALIGGAMALGGFWMAIAASTGRLGWPILAHVATNMATFSLLFAETFA